MKSKIILFVTALFLTGLACKAQDFSGGQIGNPNVLPPEVSSFQKVNFLPVSNYTGRANIDIPFFDIDLGGLSIPVSLSYNTSGVKPNDVASSVGLNWSLNTGGLITKTVKGIDDFYNDYLHQIGDIQSEIPDLYFEKRIGYLSYNANHNIEDTFPETDDLPDIFTVNAPGIDFSFIHNKGKIYDGTGWNPARSFSINKIQGTNQSGQNINITDTTTPWDLAPFILNSSNDYKIEETYGNIVLGMYGFESSANYAGGFYNRFWLDNNGSFDPNYSRYGINAISIKSTTGFQYIFDKIESSQYVLNRNEKENKTITFQNYLGVQSVNFFTNVNLVSYRLSKIIDLKTNKFVEFQYESYNQSFSEIIDNNVIGINYPLEILQPKGIWQKYPKLHRIKKIIFDKGSIVFGYGLDRMDVPGEKALTDITLFDSKNSQIKKAVLDFDYFQSNLQQSSPFSKRLKLKSVVIQGSNAAISEQYKLTYNSTSLPLRIMAVTDLFGYHNGEANRFQYNIVNNQYTILPPNTSALPNPIVFFHPNNGQNTFLPEAINSNALYLSGNYSLLPNLQYCKAAILERIDYPTGGYTTLDYELNRFKINNYEMQGGGLRIKEQKISDGTNVRTLKFEYLQTDGTSSGSVATMPKFIDFDYNVNNNAPTQSLLPNNVTLAQFNSWFSLIKNNAPKNNIELTEGSFVGYSRVKVYENNKGYTVYEYTTPSTNPNSQSDVVWHGNTGTTITPFPITGKILYNNGKLDFGFDNDVFRGKLVNESVYNQQNTLLKNTNYQYTDKIFKSMLTVRELNNIYQYYSWIPDGIFSTQPTPPYQYGYYKQRRFLLTKVIENEYFNGQLVTKSKNIEYDAYFGLVKSETQTDNMNTYKSEYYYPHDAINQNENGITGLLTANRNAERILAYDFKNNEKILETKTLYNTFSGLVLPKQIKKYKSTSISNNHEISSLEITVRDNLGNICEVTDKNGRKTAYIWGYNKSSLIAKMENTAYTSIPVNTIITAQNYSNNGTESQLINYLNNIRTSFTNALVTSYTYKPLVGVSTITDPKGDTLTYEYDTVGRLKTVRDKDNNILTENEYHYKLQN